MKITDLKSYKVVGQTNLPVEEQDSGTSGIVGIAKGFGKSFGQLGVGMAELGKKIDTALMPKFLESGQTFDVLTEGTEANVQAKEALKAKGGYEKTGKFIGDVAQFAIPGSAATKATKGASLVARAGAQAFTAGAVTSAQEGEINKDAAISATTAGVLTLAAPVVQSLFRKATTELPEWIVKPLVKQAKAQKVAGKANAEKILLESGRVGSADGLLKKTQNVISTLDDQVDEMIGTATKGGKTVNVSTIRQSVVDKINLAGGEIDDDGIKEILDRLAPQAKGLLKKDVLTVQEANTLRKAIDKTLGDRAFFATQLPFNKNVALDFVSSLREAVKSSLPDSARPAYLELSKNIELRKALLSRAMESGGPNRVGLMDLLTGLGVGTAIDPVTGVAAAVGRRALESGVAKTAMAQSLYQLGKAGPILASMQPAEQAVILSFLKRVSEDNESLDQNQQEKKPQ